jgi:predicted RNase H-like nuclease (RuvC/YqgF family)
MDEMLKNIDEHYKGKSRQQKIDYEINQRRSTIRSNSREIRKLEKENKTLEKENDILRENRWK